MVTGCCQASWYTRSLHWYCISQLMSLESEKREGAEILSPSFPGLKTKSILCSHILLYTTSGNFIFLSTMMTFSEQKTLLCGTYFHLS